MSIVVPVRDDPANLRACLAAISRQHLPPAEVIVVDDGSAEPVRSQTVDDRVRVERLDVNAGPAAARNHGARVATGDVLLFVDADVELASNAVARVTRLFADRPDVSATFGAYDESPLHPAFVSQFKNLSHRFIHLLTPEDTPGLGRVGTFWAGCGAVRKNAFGAVDGFDATKYARPCIEDVEFGVRLTAAGHRVVVDKGLNGRHRKRWTLGKLVRTDVFDRGVPWTRLMREYPSMAKELNVDPRRQRAAMLAWGLAVWTLWSARPRGLRESHPATLWLPLGAAAGVATAERSTRRSTHRSTAGSGVRRGAWMAAAGFLGAWKFGGWRGNIAVTLLALFVWTEWPMLRQFRRARGTAFATLAVPMQVLFYLYSMLALAIGTTGHVVDHVKRGLRRGMA